MQGCFNSKVLHPRIGVERTVARDDPGSQCSEGLGKWDMGCEDCAGLPDSPSGLKHLLPQLQLAAADSLGIAFTQDSPSQDWSMRVGICPTFSPPYSHQI